MIKAHGDKHGGPVELRELSDNINSVILCLLLAEVSRQTNTLILQFLRQQWTQVRYYCICKKFNKVKAKDIETAMEPGGLAVYISERLSFNRLSDHRNKSRT